MFTKTNTLSFDAVWPRLMLFGLLFTLALLVPTLGWPQPVTGSLVNALLLITVETLGLWPAIGLGMVTPLGGLLHGVLPLPLAVMTPFIMLGNATLVGVYNALRSRNRWLALAAAAVAKFALLYGAVTFLVARSLELAVNGAAQTVVMPVTIVNMMSWPQLMTALTGGLLAFAVLRGLKNQVS
jgi:hypothetical protein